MYVVKYLETKFDFIKSQNKMMMGGGASVF